MDIQSAPEARLPLGSLFESDGEASDCNPQREATPSGENLPTWLSFLVSDRSAGKRSWQRAALFAAWLGLIAWLCFNHVFWRDEIRALSLALSGNGVVEMLRNVHGEGHPALWYLILRGGHS